MREQRLRYHQSLQRAMFGPNAFVEPQVLDQENPSTVKQSEPVYSKLRMLKYNSKTLESNENDDPNCNSHIPVRKQKDKTIATTATKILDAPNLEDDFYLNLLDWSSQNQLAIALQEIYLQNTETLEIDILTNETDNGQSATSLSYHKSGNYLAVGQRNSEIKIWDITKMSVLRTMKTHSDRVSSLAWNDELLSSGSKDS